MKNSYAITDVSANEILDSRGNPTVKVMVKTESSKGEFSVPSGASTGSHEAIEMRDGDKNRFHGLGVLKAVETVEKYIRKALIGKDVRDQKNIDAAMLKLDGTYNKGKLGANGMLGASMACAKAAAAATGQPLHIYLSEMLKTKEQTPKLYLNLINAGKHASSHLAFQEFMIVPMTDNAEEALIIADKIKNELRKEVLKKYGPFSANYGDEGGIVIEAKKVSEPLAILTAILKKLKLRNKVGLAIDAAASSFYENGKYSIDGKKISADDLLKLYRSLIKKFPLISIEDPFHEEDFANFRRLLELEPEIKVVGDDLTTTNPDRLLKAIQEKSINAIIIKPNQIGTLSETLEVMKLAEDHRISCIVSHRSGETGDDFIADLAFAFGAFGLKAGASNRGERVAKYNRLMEISKK